MEVNNTLMVTGGCGFIGSNFLHMLSDMKYDGKVVNVDCMTYAADTINLQDVSLDMASAVERIDDAVAMDRVFEKYHPDMVVNFAAESHVDRSITGAGAFILSNVMGVQVLLDMAKKHGVRRFLQVSTDEVYGDLDEKEPASVETDHLKPSSPYSASKAAADLLALAYVRTHGMDVVITRCLSGGELMSVLVGGIQKNIRLDELYGLMDSGRSEVLVPGYDKKTNRVSWRRVEKAFKNVNAKPMIEIRTRYGRRVKLTCDHVVFRLTKDDNAVTGKPMHRTVPMFGEEVEARQICVGDKIAVSLKSQEGEVDVACLDLGAFCCQQSWASSVRMLKPPTQEERNAMMSMPMSERSRFRYAKKGWTPLVVARDWKRRAICSSASSSWVPAGIPLDADMLWLFGLLVAEGCVVSNYHDHVVSVSSDEVHIDRAVGIIRDRFGLKCKKRFDSNGVPTCYVRSKIVVSFLIWLLALGASKKTRISEFVLNLPNRRLKYVLQGLFDGDGVHFGRSVLKGYKTDGMSRARGANLFKVTSASRDFMMEMVGVLQRFGIVASVGERDVVLKGKTYKASTIEASGVDDIRPMTWKSNGNGQRSSYMSNVSGDVLWTQVVSVAESECEDVTYDLQVEGLHTYVTASGIVVHNCSNNYGPRQYPEKLIPLAIKRVMEGKKIPVYGQGTNIRDWIYVDDHCRGIWEVLTKGRTGGVYNLGGSNQIRNIEVVRILLGLMGKGEECIEYVTDRPGHDFRYDMDFGKASRELGWYPNMPFEAGMKKTVEWYMRS